MSIFPGVFNLPSAGVQTGMALSEADRADMIGFLQRLVQTPSHSGGEEAVASLIADELRKVGVEDIVVDEAGSVLARIGTGDGPTVLYDTHMDTVHPSDAEWPYNPYGGHIEDGVLYGLGACDMKGAIASVVYGVKKLIDKDVQLNGTLALAFVVQQEPCEGCALQLLLAETGIEPDAVLLCEPSDMDIMRGHRGRVMFKVTVRGKSAHASNPEVGRNAITGAARLIFGIDMLSVDLASDPFLGPGTVTVTHIDSHAPSLNAIPDTCTFYVDRRLTLGETPTRAQAQIETIVEREGIDARIEVLEYCGTSYTGYEIRDREAFNAWALDQNHDLVRTLGNVLDRVRGGNFEIGHWPFSTDGVYTMSVAGVPSVGFGPGNPRLAHTVNDCVALDDVASAAQVYGLFAASMLG